MHQRSSAGDNTGPCPGSTPDLTSKSMIFGRFHMKLRLEWPSPGVPGAGFRPLSYPPKSKSNWGCALAFQSGWRPTTPVETSLLCANCAKTIRQYMVFDDPWGSVARGGPVHIPLVVCVGPESFRDASNRFPERGPHKNSVLQHRPEPASNSWSSKFGGPLKPAGEASSGFGPQSRTAFSMFGLPSVC